MRTYPLFFLVFLSLLAACSDSSEVPAGPYSESLSAPGGQLELQFTVDESGTAAYRLNRGDVEVIPPSGLGFTFAGAPDLKANWQVQNVDKSSFDESWEQVWGEQRTVQNRYSEMKVDLLEGEAPGRKFSLIFRLYDDGLGFRYHFPQQEAMDSVLITAELTEFSLTGDPY